MEREGTNTDMHTGCIKSREGAKHRLGKASDRPFVFLNLAISADGKIASANHRVSGFGSEVDHRHLWELRSRADAILIGARTADTAPVKLDTGGARFQRKRLRDGHSEHAVRVVVSGTGSLDAGAEIFRHHFSPVVVLTSGRISSRRRRDLAAVADEVAEFGDWDVDWGAALWWLWRRYGICTLLGEGGGVLNDALFRAGVVDELHVTLCPVLMGGLEAPTIADGRGFGSLSEAALWQLVSHRRRGDEWFLVFRRRGE